MYRCSDTCRLKYMMFQVVAGTCIDDVSPLTGRTWSFNSMRTFLGHTVDPDEDFWNFNDDNMVHFFSLLDLFKNS